MEEQFLTTFFMILLSLFLAYFVIDVFIRERIKEIRFTRKGLVINKKITKQAVFIGR